MNDSNSAIPNEEISIRSCEPQDAEGLLRLTQCLARETRHMLMEPDEADRPVKEHRDRIERARKSDDEQLFVAVNQEQLIGFIATHRRPFRRVRHCFHLVLGVRRSHWGRGIGRRLLQKAEAWAVSAGARRLELTVSAENERAFQLYRHFGFQVEGIRKDSLYIGGQYKDEILMGKWLPS